MNTEIITKAARATLEGTLPFPEIVGQLISAGVEYYHVDYVAMRKTFYSADGDTVTTAIDYEGLPPVAADFDHEALRANILDSQRNGQEVPRFQPTRYGSRNTRYFAFLRGKRVTYFGRQGDQHTEWFPGAAPAQTTGQ